MPVEVWGTFSVVDHLRKRPYVADLLLYDKLVIPVVPENDAKVYKRWTERNWRPDDLKRIVEVLNEANPELVWAVPWDLQKNENFKSRLDAAKAVALDTYNLATSKEIDPNRPAFFVTRFILADFAGDPENQPDIPSNVWVDPMAAYPSYQAFKEDVSVRRMKTPSPKSSVTRMAGVFGWKFVVPEDSRMSDVELIKVAAELASDQDFRAKRRSFHEWRRKVISEGVTDSAALEEMTELAEQYNKVVRKSGMRTKVLNGCAVAGIAAGIAASFAVPVAGIAGAFLAAGVFGLDKWMPRSEPTQEQKAAAMFHDARKGFGWK